MFVVVMVWETMFFCSSSQGLMICPSFYHAYRVKGRRVLFWLGILNTFLKWGRLLVKLYALTL